MFYPIYLNLENKRVVVIGGGAVAERKVESLLDTGASITVISVDMTPRLRSLHRSGRIQVEQRAYVAGDCAGAFLVFSATDDAAVGEFVFQEAQRVGALVNTADQPRLCDFIMPAVVRRGEVAIAISTGGASPGLASRLRRKIADAVGPEYAEFAALLSQARAEIRKRVPDERRRKAVHDRILDSDIMERLARGDAEGARRRLQEIIES